MKLSLFSLRSLMIFSAFGLLVIGCSVLKAGPVTYRSIPDIVAESDLIAVGHVLSIDALSGATEGRIRLIPADILKGDAVSGALVLAYRGIARGRGDSLTGRRVLTFAKRNPNTNEFTLLPLIQGSGTILEQQLLSTTSPTPQAAIQRASQDTLLQKVIKELVTIHLNSSSADTLPYLLPLAWNRVEPQLVAEAFRTIQRSSSPRGFVSGTMGLVALGDLEGLESLDAAEIQGNAELHRIIPNVERFYRSPSSRGIEILSQWLRSSDPSKRYAAAGALARVHTPEAILSLGPALHDMDFEVRWRVIGGLSMFANNVPIGGAGPAPSDWRFRTEETARFSIFDRDRVQKDERPYLEFWRRWWIENQAAVASLVESQGH